MYRCAMLRSDDHRIVPPRWRGAERSTQSRRRHLVTSLPGVSRGPGFRTFGRASFALSPDRTGPGFPKTSCVERCRHGPDRCVFPDLLANCKSVGGRLKHTARLTVATNPRRERRHDHYDRCSYHRTDHSRGLGRDRCQPASGYRTAALLGRYDSGRSVERRRPGSRGCFVLR